MWSETFSISLTRISVSSLWQGSQGVGVQELRVRTPKYSVVSCSLARISLSASAANSKVIKLHNVAHTPRVARQKQTQRESGEGREERKGRKIKVEPNLFRQTKRDSEQRSKCGRRLRQIWKSAWLWLDRDLRGRERGGFADKEREGFVNVCLPQGQRGFVRQFMARVVYIYSRQVHKGACQAHNKEKCLARKLPRGQ